MKEFLFFYASLAALQIGLSDFMSVGWRFGIGHRSLAAVLSSLL